MIYIKSFKNYEEFQTIFGMTKHGNGTESRKNKILLACLKDRKLLHWWLGFRKLVSAHGSIGLQKELEDADYLKAANMDKLKNFAKFLLGDASYVHPIWNNACNSGYRLNFGDEFPYEMYSPTLRLDKFHGLCTDGDAKAIRYVNTERDDKAFKMKAGKFISKCIEDSFLGNVMPEQMKRWIGEEFAREWQSYAEQRVGKGKYTLHVDNNFSDIYDSDRCKGDFGSCMTDKENWYFYRDSIDCKAAYLTDADDNIVARCIVYQDVKDEDGNHYRLAERQYSTGQDDVLKQILVDMLIKEGEIDGYKRVGADCHDNRNFVRNDGTSMRDLTLSIMCCLDYGETVSYQDSFVFYNKDKHIAYNDDDMDFDYELNTTNGQLEGGDWSEYNQCYIDDAYWDEFYEDYMYPNQSVCAICGGHCIDINGERAEEHDATWKWSEHEKCYIYHEECRYIEEEDDYFLCSDCVEDINGKWQLEEDCHWSDYHGGYILKRNADWSSHLDSYIDDSESVFCKYDDDFTHKDKAVYSKITEDYYCSEKSMLEDEAAFRILHAPLATA